MDEVSNASMRHLLVETQAECGSSALEAGVSNCFQQVVHQLSARLLIRQQAGWHPALPDYALPSVLKPAETKVSPNGLFALMGRQTLFVKDALIERCNEGLAEVGALVRLQPQDRQMQAGQFQLRQVSLSTLSVLLARKDKRWGSVQEAERQSGRFVAFADCARTAGMVAGFNPDRVQTLCLPLKTGSVNLMGGLCATELKVGQSIASRAEATFHLHALPEFVELLQEQGTHVALRQYLADRLPKLQQLPGHYGPSLYLKIREIPAAYALFCEHFGVDDALSAQIGVGIVQIGNQVERERALSEDIEKWNYHWEATLMTDGDVCVTLGNLALDLQDMTPEEQRLNQHITDPKINRNLQKNDVVNSRYFFSVYHGDSRPFHHVNLQSASSTPGSLTLPVSHRG